MTTAVADNYRYWRDHGGDWAAEYARRKTWMVLYHIQEIMLSEYVLRHARAKPEGLRVLEFGCGVGRHLFNLRKLPGVDAHGYDQSDAMARSMLAWASPEWYKEHVTVGDPTGRLPYEDASFDLVYTAEVLVHVRPEDLQGVLSELVRVCRGHTLHFEPSDDYPVYSDVHSGCWKHDLPVSYSAMGLQCETLERGYKAHTPMRTSVAEAPVFRWEPAVLELYRTLEENIDRGFDVTDAAIKRLEAENASLHASLTGLDGECEALRTEAAAAGLRAADLSSRLDAESTAASVARAELEATRTQAGELSQQVSALQDASEGLRSQLEQTREALESSRSAEAGLRGSLAAESAEVQRLADELARVRGELERTAAEFERSRKAWVLESLGSDARTGAWQSRARELEAKLGTVGAALEQARAVQSDFVAAVRAALR
ncbi:MAG: methyltransferase domain-containing protein [Phycisphaerales bacterium]